MNTLLVILSVLFITLLVGIPLLERFSGKNAGEGEGMNYGNISRFVFPLMAALIIVQMIRYWFS